MRIHTSLSLNEMHDALKASGALIYFKVLSEHGSRTHARSFDVILSGSSTSRSQNGNFFAATWDEWGAFLGALYDADINARCGGSVKRPIYRDAEHYHFVTGSRFRNVVKWSSRLKCYLPNYLPADTHLRHRWEYVGSDGFRCKHVAADGTKCSAYRPSWDQVEAYAPRSYR